MLLKISRSSLYRKTVEPRDTNNQNMHRICEIYEQNPFYGYRRIHVVLQREGVKINRKKVQRLMRTNGLKALYPKKKTSVRNHAHAIFPYLLRDTNITRANQAWCTDITYIKIRGGFVYCVALIDVFSRRVIGSSVSPFLDVKSCLVALEMALLQAVPEIINSDQGCQFTSKEWVAALATSNIKISMDGKGRWADNIAIERFWRSLKYEDIYLNSYETVDQVSKGIAAYIVFYNAQRPHQALGYNTPDAVYFGSAKGLLQQQVYDNNHLIDVFKKPILSSGTFFA